MTIVLIAVQVDAFLNLFRLELRHRQLVTCVPVASASRAVLLTVTTERALSAKPTEILEHGLRVSQRRGDNASVEIDQVRVVRETVARGRLGC